MEFNLLKTEVQTPPAERCHIAIKYYAEGYEEHPDKPNVLRIAYATASLFEKHRKYVYDNDRILGSLRGKLGPQSEIRDDANKVFWSSGRRSFQAGSDHYAGNYENFVKRGLPGTFALIEESLKRYSDDKDKVDFLSAAKITLEAFRNVLLQYAEEAEKKGLTDAANDCRFIADNKPETFAQGFQLVFMSYILFTYDEKYAMAFGRIDQYLYPLFKKDIDAGIITHEEAVDIVASGFIKLHEWIYIHGGDDVANIAIGGVDPDTGNDATNELSYVVLEAVNKCHIPGPNLSAKINKNTSIDFIDTCLKVTGTGLGYPALMNDDVNIAALRRYGYPLHDCRNYCMVGCIENFIQGKQPPWGDGRFNSPKYLEYALNDGVCFLTGEQKGLKTGDPSEFDTMEKLIDAFDKQLRYGAKQYADYVVSVQKSYDPKFCQSPFMSCFCDGCLEKGLDINNGGAVYPSTHGACCMGIATIADSLAAIEKLVFIDKKLTLSKYVEILKADFEGYDKERKWMLDCPKYGNDDDFVDKYAVWFNEEHYNIFKEYKTYDGGPFYVAIASNTANIPAGKELGATPDGRRSKAEMSDAASPMHGMDKKGPTAALLSLCKPDYTLSATGTVVNQKYPPSMFTDDDNRRKLATLIKVYFDQGGQEIQINSVSRKVLEDAIANPDKYASLVVRVSGFSAYYTKLDIEVQKDILKRTEHTSI